MPAIPFTPSRLKQFIRTNSVRKGLLGGSRFWFVMFLAGYAVRWSAKLTKRGEMPIRFSESLKPGESLVIRHVDPAG